jgi:multidrug efflux pump subunit AcrA (membrane-fusion protein)
MRSSTMLPVKILGAAALVVLVLFFARRTPEDRVLQDTAPLVRVTLAEPTPYQFSVTAHGSVSPRTESDLIPQVSGEVLWISPSLAGGGFFESGDVLARIDQADYRVAHETARAAVARAKSEHGRAEKELSRQRSLATRSVASESRIDDAENAFRVAEAVLQQEQARFERAARDLARTDLTAPYRGRVRSEQVDVGQFVTRGAPIARLYAVDYAEIRLAPACCSPRNLPVVIITGKRCSCVRRVNSTHVVAWYISWLESPTHTGWKPVPKRNEQRHWPSASS